MTNLKQQLQTAVDRSDKGGGALSVNAIRQLKAYRQRQFLIFLVFEFVIFAAVVACALYLLGNSTETAVAKAAAGAIGLGSGGGLEVGRRLWKEWARTDLTLLLLAEASEAQAKALIDRLLKTL
jgi:hypothetical protein